ncbi:hypothetical protein MRB53_003840 [Persea americana]|uniref:Uncharacterized protein n=1 Tax=Persea americana TaxID=3435 RepID=A0ACC2MYC6_PERAE|nr:hypothetical protein MRB53_003840 [Persea americana]
MHLEPAAATPLSSPFFFPSTPSFPSLLSLLVKKKGATGLFAFKCSVIATSHLVQPLTAIFIHEKKALKEDKLKQEEKYMWAVVDGVKEKLHGASAMMFRLKRFLFRRRCYLFYCFGVYGHFFFVVIAEGSRCWCGFCVAVFQGFFCPLLIEPQMG